MSRLYKFKEIQDLAGFGTGFSTEEPFFMVLKNNGSGLKGFFDSVKYNDKDTLCFQTKADILLAGARKGTEAVEVILSNGTEKIEGFISPPTVFIQSASDDETRLSIPAWYGNEKAMKTAEETKDLIESAIADLMEKHNVSRETALALIRSV